MATDCFNINDLVEISITRNVSGLFSRMNPEMEYFRTEQLKSPDIFLDITNFTPDLSDTEKCGDFHIKKNYVYTELSGCPVEVRGLDDEPIHIRISPRLKGIRKLWPALACQNLLLRPLIQLVGMRKGFIFVHGAGVEKNGTAHVFAGRPGVFKTSLAIDLVGRGYSFYGDENVILKERMIMPYPFNLSSFQYKYEVRKEKLNKYERFLLFMRLISGSPSRIKIGTPSRKLHLYYVEKTGHDFHIDDDVDGKYMIERLYLNEFEEIDIAPTHTFSGIKNYNFRDMLKAYVSVNRDSEIKGFWDFIKREITLLVKEAKTHIIHMPDRYDHGYAAIIDDHIRGWNDS